MLQKLFRADPFSLPFDAQTTVLIIIDMQRDFVEPGGFGEALGNNVSLVRGAIVSSWKVLKAARDSKLLIIHTREGYRADLADCPPSKLTRGGKTFIGADGPMGRVLIRGEAGHDIIPELYPALGEPIIDKPGKGAFHETDLQLILQNHSIRTLIVCGVSTEASVTTTVREANDRGYECIIPADCVGSYFPEFQRSALDMIKAQGAMSGWVSDAAAIVDGLRG
jgi:nicotinamidase-related amidase